MKRLLGDQSLASAVNRESETKPLRHLSALSRGGKICRECMAGISLSCAVVVIVFHTFPSFFYSQGKCLWLKAG